MSGPGDRAPKGSMREADAVNDAEGHGTPPKNGRGGRAPAGVQGVRHAQKPLARKLGDLGGASPPVVGGRQPWEGQQPQATVAASEKSDEVVVPEKPAKTRVTPVESVEGRAEAKGTLDARNALSTQELFEIDDAAPQAGRGPDVRGRNGVWGSR